MTKKTVTLLAAALTKKTRSTIALITAILTNKIVETMTNKTLD